MGIPKPGPHRRAFSTCLLYDDFREGRARDQTRRDSVLGRRQPLGLYDPGVLKRLPAEKLERYEIVA